MKKWITYSLIATSLCLVCFGATDAIAQSKAVVQNVDFFLEGENLIISYDITKAKSDEVFEVSVNIKTVTGTKISAYSLSGDVGAGVSGGSFKRISWDLKTDNAYLDDEIFVEVIAKPMVLDAVAKPMEHKSVGGAMLRSLIFPGWGNRFAKDGGAYWLIGIAAYGSVGASFYYNNQANSSYDDYKNSLDPDERDKLYQEASDNYDMQQNLMYAAGAIWLIDIIWSGIQAGNVNKKVRKNNVSYGYYYDPAMRTPMFSLTVQLK